MEKKTSRIGISDIILAVVSIAFPVGILTVFKSCDPMENGSWMTCHWAGNAVAGAAVVLAVIAVIHLIFADRKIKTGLSIAMIPVAVFAAFTPQNVIHLCMMENMRCRALMRPAAIVCSILVVAAAVFDIVVYTRKQIQ